MVHFTCLSLRLTSENDLLLVKALAPRYDGCIYDLVKGMSGVPHAVKLCFDDLTDATGFLNGLHELNLKTV